MPIYEYSCDACGHGLEALQAINDDALVDCPECSEPTLRKRISATAFRLKGGGWYETDFKSGNKRNLAGEGGGGESKSSGGGEAKSGGESKSSGSGDAKGGGTGTGKAADG